MEPQMDLKDTVEMMLSDDYKERFKAEYRQVTVRLEKLKAYLKLWDRCELTFTPDCPRSTYDLQRRGMEDYVAALEARAVMEGIDIE